MATTQITTTDSRSITQYQQERIAEEALKYNVLAIKGMIGDDPNANVIVTESDLAKGKGDTVNYYLEMKLSGQGVTSNGTLRGNEEQLVHYQDTVKIDQIRNGVILDGRMTEQRTRIKLRKRAPRALGRWGGEWLNELAVTMLSGKRGTNSGKLSTAFTGFAGNTLTDLDSTHLTYAGSATAKANLASTDKFDLTAVERFVTTAETISPQVLAIPMDGENKWLGLLHPYQARDMRTNTNTFQWADFQKAVTQGGKEGLYKKNALGEHANVIFHKSQDVRTFTDYGAGANVAAARALFLGAQAGVIAYGEGYGDQQWEYVEIKDDYNNQNGFGTGLIVGIKRCVFNSLTYGLIGCDSAAAA